MEYRFTTKPQWSRLLFYLLYPEKGLLRCRPYLQCTRATVPFPRYQCVPSSTSTTQSQAIQATLSIKPSNSQPIVTSTKHSRSEAFILFLSPTLVLIYLPSLLSQQTLQDKVKTRYHSELFKSANTEIFSYFPFIFKTSRKLNHLPCPCD